MEKLSRWILFLKIILLQDMVLLFLQRMLEYKTSGKND